MGLLDENVTEASELVLGFAYSRLDTPLIIFVVPFSTMKMPILSRPVQRLFCTLVCKAEMLSDANFTSTCPPLFGLGNISSLIEQEVKTAAQMAVIENSLIVFIVSL